VINLKSAKALGLMLARADEVIDKTLQPRSR
jgi:hypothetical protein